MVGHGGREADDSFSWCIHEHMTAPRRRCASARPTGCRRRRAPQVWRPGWRTPQDSLTLAAPHHRTAASLWALGGAVPRDECMRREVPEESAPGGQASELWHHQDGAFTTPGPPGNAWVRRPRPASATGRTTTAACLRPRDAQYACALRAGRSCVECGVCLGLRRVGTTCVVGDTRQGARHRAVGSAPGTRLSF